MNDTIERIAKYYGFLAREEQLRDALREAMREAYLDIEKEALKRRDISADLSNNFQDDYRRGEFRAFSEIADSCLDKAGKTQG